MIMSERDARGPKDNEACAAMLLSLPLRRLLDGGLGRTGCDSGPQFGGAVQD